MHVFVILWGESTSILVNVFNIITIHNYSNTARVTFMNYLKKTTANVCKYSSNMWIIMLKCVLQEAG